MTPWTVGHQVPLSMEFSRLEYWTGLPFPFPEDLPKPAIELRSPALQEDSLPSESPENMLGNYFQNILTITFRLTSWISQTAQHSLLADDTMILTFLEFLAQDNHLALPPGMLRVVLT